MTKPPPAAGAIPASNAIDAIDATDTTAATANPARFVAHPLTISSWHPRQTLTSPTGMALNPGEGLADKRRMPVEMLERCLRALVDENGSDLHLKAGSPPRIRVNGSLTKLSAEAALTATDVADMAQAMPDHANDGIF